MTTAAKASSSDAGDDAPAGGPNGHRRGARRRRRRAATQTSASARLNAVERPGVKHEAEPGVERGEREIERTVELHGATLLQLQSGREIASPLLRVGARQDGAQVDVLVAAENAGPLPCQLRALFERAGAAGVHEAVEPVAGVVEGFAGGIGEAEAVADLVRERGADEVAENVDGAAPCGSRDRCARGSPSRRRARRARALRRRSPACQCRGAPDRRCGRSARDRPRGGRRVTTDARRSP